MTTEQETHINQILGEFIAEAKAKYEAGQQEHGGNLWEKRGMLTHAIEEAIDQVMYLYTLRRQLRERGIEV
jgi:hypothetical protein